MVSRAVLLVLLCVFYITVEAVISAPSCVCDTSDCDEVQSADCPGLGIVVWDPCRLRSPSAEEESINFQGVCTAAADKSFVVSIFIRTTSELSSSLEKDGEGRQLEYNFLSEGQTYFIIFMEIDTRHVLIVYNLLTEKKDQQQSGPPIVMPYFYQILPSLADGWSVRKSDSECCLASLACLVRVWSETPAVGPAMFSVNRFP
ncbi:crimpy [Carabus blaptoides fortunei]